MVGLPRQDAMATWLDAVLEHVELSPPLANWPAGAGGGVRLSTRRLAGRAGAQLTLRRWRATSNPHTFAAEAWLMESAGWLGQRAPRRAALGRQPAPASLAGPLAAAAVARVTRAAGEHTLQRRAHRADYRRAGYIPPEHWRLFAQTGLTHLVSVSGVSDLAGRPGGQRHHLAVAAVKPAGACRWLAGAVAGYWPPAPMVCWSAGRCPPSAAYTCCGRWPWPCAAAIRWGRLRLGAGAVRGADAGPFCRLVAGLLAVVFRRGADDLGGRRAGGRRHGGGNGGPRTVAASLATAVPLLASFGELPWLSPLSNLYAIPLIGSVLTLAALLASALPTDLGVAGWRRRWTGRCGRWSTWPTRRWAQAAPTTLAIALASLGVAVLSLPAGGGRARAGAGAVPAIVLPA